MKILTIKYNATPIISSKRARSRLGALKRHRKAALPRSVSISVKTRPVKAWGSADGLGHAMFGWPMEEEAQIIV